MTSGADCAPQPSSWSGRTPKRTPADAVGLKLGASEDRATAAAARFDPLHVWSVRHGADVDRLTMHRRRDHLDWTVATSSPGGHESVRSVRAFSIGKAPPGRLPAMVGGPLADPRLRQSNRTCRGLSTHRTRGGTADRPVRGGLHSGERQPKAGLPSTGRRRNRSQSGPVGGDSAAVHSRQWSQRQRVGGVVAWI